MFARTLFLTVTDTIISETLTYPPESPIQHEMMGQVKNEL
jgi:hypothetical protein